MLRRITSRVQGRTAAVQVLLCLALLTPSLAFSQGFARFSVPIPVEIEGKPVRSQLYFKLELKSYNVPFDQFAAEPLDAAQKMFVTAVDGIRKNDTATFASVWTAPDQMKGVDSLAVKLTDDSPANWMKLARSNLDFDHLTIVAEVLLGPDSLFIFDSTLKAGVQRNALYVGLDKNGRERLSVVNSGTPLELMVMNAFVGARTAPDEYKPLPNINLRYQYPIPLAGKADAGSHPVFFEFDGMPMDFPVTDEKVKAPTPLLEFVRNADLAYKSGNFAVYANDFTVGSQERLRPWLAETERRKQERLKQEKLNGEQSPAPSPGAGPTNKAEAAAAAAVAAHVKFVLNGGPFFLVFKAPGPGSGWKPANLTYSYILQQGGDYKIANFSFSTTLDDFLQNTSLFNRNILKPVPPKPGTVNSKPAPGATKPPAVKHQR